MTNDEEVFAYLKHFGVRGQKWGIRRAIRKENFGEVKTIQKQHKKTEKVASKDPTFKREVALSRKGKGIKVKNLDVEVTKGELLTGRVKGTFRDSTGKKVSEDFGNAVINKATKRPAMEKLGIAGGATVAGFATASFLLNRGGKTLPSIAIGTTAAALGATVAKNILDRDKGGRFQ